VLEQVHAGATTTRLPVLVRSTSPHLLDNAQAHAERYRNHHHLDEPVDVDALLAHLHELIGDA
jgi:hypothetical protein